MKKLLNAALNSLLVFSFFLYPFLSFEANAVHSITEESLLGKYENVDFSAKEDLNYLLNLIVSDEFVEGNLEKSSIQNAKILFSSARKFALENEGKRNLVIEAYSKELIDNQGGIEIFTEKIQLLEKGEYKFSREEYKAYILGSVTIQIETGIDTSQKVLDNTSAAYCKNTYIYLKEGSFLGGYYFRPGNRFCYNYSRVTSAYSTGQYITHYGAGALNYSWVGEAFNNMYASGDKKHYRSAQRGVVAYSVPTVGTFWYEYPEVHTKMRYDGNYWKEFGYVWHF